MKLSYRNERNAKIIAAQYGKPLNKPDWYEIKAVSEIQSEILIFDYIGWPYNDPYDFVSYLQTIPENDLTVRIHSPGGDIFDGLVIYNGLENHKGKVTIINEGLAASMASVIATAGKNRQAYSNAMFMYHNGWTCVAGDHNELRATADVLAKIKGNMVDIYSAKSNMGKRDVSAMMDAETWMTAKEAKEKGFIDTIIESGSTAKAKFDLSIFSNVPDGMFGEREGRELTEREAERALRDAGASRAYAKLLVAGSKQDNAKELEESKRAEDVNACNSEINKIIETIGVKTNG